MDITSFIVAILFVVVTAGSVIAVRVCGFGLLASMAIGIPIGYVIVFFGLWIAGRMRHRR